MAIYDKHIEWFTKNPYKGLTGIQAYAQNIIDREKSGDTNWTDPAAIQAFKKDYPQYFSTPSGGGSSGGGSSGGGGSASSKPIYQGHLDWFARQFPGQDPYKVYAQKILEGEKAGTLHDPAAAAAFKKDYPSLFQQTTTQTAQGVQPGQPSPGIPGQGVYAGQTNIPASWIPIMQWFQAMGQSVTKDPSGKLTAGGLTFAPGSYVEEGGQYYVNPVSLAGMYLNKPRKELTPELMSQYTGMAEQYYAPQREARLNALKEALGERKAAARRSAISRGTYTSGIYDEDLITRVEQPYAKELGNLESELASLINTYATQKYDQERAAEEAQIAQIVNYLLGIANTALEQDKWKTLTSLQYAGGLN